MRRARLGEGLDQVLDDCHEGRRAEVCETLESSVNSGKTVRHRRGYEPILDLGDSPADLAWNDHIRAKRGVGTMLLQRVRCWKEHPARFGVWCSATSGSVISSRNTYLARHPCPPLTRGPGALATAGKASAARPTRLPRLRLLSQDPDS